MKDRFILIGLAIVTLITEIVFNSMFLLFFIAEIPLFLFSNKLLKGALDLLKIPGLRVRLDK